ncbi:hypothetical protein VTN77DRAFT_9872 [Rasamsonia byssochlamydoides]|uniref:uncharacterized protein n=1 Tax=Rasamsonia byssochlamydoides TaxID=89139 RepID=UPI003743E5B8
MQLALSTVLLGFLAAWAHGYANPGGCSGACNVHDPSLIRRQSDGRYFRFSTGNKISYASASSIEGPWTVVGSMLPGGSSIDLAGNDDLWAPDAQIVDGTYYVYYSVSTFGSQNSAIGLATSPTMEAGSWTDHGSVDVASSSSKAYNSIDGNLFHDSSSGTYYLTFGSFWHDLYQVPMNSAATKASSSSYNIAYDPSGDHAEEGSYLYQYGSYYYLFYSAGICCGYDTSRPASGEEYKIKVCRSTSPTGGFVDKDGVACTNGGGTIVLESHGTVYGPGGQ